MLCGVAAVTKVNLHKLSTSSFDSFHLSVLPGIHFSKLPKSFGPEKVFFLSLFYMYKSWRLFFIQTNSLCFLILEKL